MAFFTCLSLALVVSLVRAQNGDGGAASGNIPAVAGGGDAAGAVGSSTGIVKLSTGAIVAIAIVVFAVVVIAILTAVLFYQAKKRQWTVRETIRHSRRRVTTGLKSVMTPLTPHRTTFSPNSFKSKSSDKEAKGLKGPSPLRKGEANKGIGLDVDMNSLARQKDASNNRRDLEKGEGSRVVVEEMMRREREKRVGIWKGQPKEQQQQQKQQQQQQQQPQHEKKNSDTSSDSGSERRIHKPQKPSVSIPKSGKKVEEQVPKTPMFSRVFGRE